jgi:zinc transport system permease protein
MRRAILVCVLISLMVPLMGTVIVLKRLSTMGEALSHTGLAGVAIGLAAGLNPVAVAAVVSVLASLAIEYIRKAFPKYAEIAANVVLSAGIGAAAIVSGFIKNPASFNSFLFGSIVSISPFETRLVIGLSVIVIFFSVTMYKELLFITMDEEAARLVGVPANALNIIFTVMTAVMVSVTARTVGALMISSLIVIPVACALLLARSYRQTVLYAIGFAFVFTLSGLAISVAWNLKPGGTIVLTGVLCLFILLAIRKFASKK